MTLLPKLPVGSCLLLGLLLGVASCQSPGGEERQGIRLVTLDPGHFHAALVQKTMYPGIDSVVHVYAPGGPELQSQLDFIHQYNTRAENPTHWKEEVYTGPDFLDKMLADKAGNVVVMAGNNQRKTEYIKKTIDAGMNVLADKPMAISAEGFELLRQAFQDADSGHVLLYDIMTERSEITSILQKALLHSPAVFGTLDTGTTASPAVVLESVHRYFKQVSGQTLVRPDWFFDPRQEGDAIVDVGTHLVDLVQWICFPDAVLDYARDIRIDHSRIWPTPITLSQFSVITRANRFPGFLQPYVVDDSVLQTHGNGEIDYTIKGIHARVTAKWTFDAPAGAGDTYSSLMRGSRATLEIRQGEAEAYEPTLYIRPLRELLNDAGYAAGLEDAIAAINKDYPGVQLKKGADGWTVVIPQTFKVGHEAHFGQVMERYLHYLQAGSLPAWEVPGMLAKYYTTTKALEMAQQSE